MPEITLSQGTVHYRDAGQGPVAVFVHGVLVDGRVWEPVVERLPGELRCVVPDLPLGSHRTPMRRDADLSPTGLARLIADLIAALDLEDVTLVGNDTGGALCQLVAGRHPERLARLVLTPCDAFESFPPKAFRGLVLAARAHLLTVGLQPVRLRRLRRLPLAYGWLT
jgi:pimeloyl-ACP methyl ester carboxylesterase